MTFLTKELTNRSKLWLKSVPKSASTPSIESFSTFGDLLKFLRRRARLTQREVAIAVGYSEAQISRLEQNQRAPDLSALTALFIPALFLEDEPEIVARLMELAAQARGEDIPREGPVTFSHAVRQQIVETSRTVEENPRNNLPFQITSFVGRQREISELRELLKTSRLVTLTGAGGCGKTRLALEAASQFAASYPDGVWLIELAPVTDPNLILPIMASTLGIANAGEADPTKTLTTFLQIKQTLLVLDNCEQIVADAARLVETILLSCPQVRILVTSREILDIAGEIQFRVPALSLDSDVAAGCGEAAQLFLERARAVLPQLALTDSMAEAIAEICRLVDGLPLGIELAAAKVNVLSVEQIAARLHDSFQMLRGGRNRLPHHQTLETTIQWSYDLLSEPERVLLQRLSVFSGGWTLHAAEMVTSDAHLVPREHVLGLLTQLINKSLVTVGRLMESEARYTMLQTIHEFSRRKLHETGSLHELRARHFDYFHALAQKARLFGDEKRKWLDALEMEHDNIRAALGWSLEAGLPEKGATAILPIIDFYWYRGFASEALAWMRKFLAMEAEPSALRALLLQKAGWLTRAAGEFETANGLLHQALDMALEAGDPNRAAWALMDLGLSVREQGDYKTAIASFSRGLQFARDGGERRAVGACLYLLAECHELIGDLATARKYWEDGLHIFRAEGDPSHIAWGMEGMAGTAYLAKNYEGATQFHLESLNWKAQVMDKLGIAYSLEGLAQVLAAAEASEGAAVLWGAADALRTSLNVPLEASRRDLYTSLIPHTRAQVGDEAFNRLWEQGRAMNVEEAVGFALRLVENR